MIKVNGKVVAGLGLPGKSAYQAAKENGYTGTEEEFNQSLGKLNELFTSVSEGKALVAAAVTDKGVETAADATFQQMADNINAIQTGTVQKKYIVTNDSSNTFYPTEAYPGEYVFTTTGEYVGTPNVYDEAGTNRLFIAHIADNINSLPPKIQEALKNFPITFAPPMANTGYAFFVMPEENVKIITGG